MSSCKFPNWLLLHIFLSLTITILDVLKSLQKFCKLNKFKIERLLFSPRKLVKSVNSTNNSSLLYMCLLKMRPRISQKLCSVRTPTVIFLNVIEIHPMKVYIFKMRVVTCENLYIRLLSLISKKIFYDLLPNVCVRTLIFLIYHFYQHDVL